MNNNPSSDIITEKVIDEDGTITTRTTVQLLHGAPIVLEVSWRPAENGSHYSKEDSRLMIGDLSFSVPEMPLPMAHYGLIEQQLGMSCDADPLGDTSENLQQPKRVYIVSRYDGVGVFLDRISAAFWAGDAKKVKEVSIEGAALALKTDKETVAESARAASSKSWETIQAVLALVSIANDAVARIDEMGLSVEDLQKRISWQCYVCR